MKITTALAIAAAFALNAPGAQAQTQGQPGIMSLGCIDGAIAGGLLGTKSAAERARRWRRRRALSRAAAPATRFNAKTSVKLRDAIPTAAMRDEKASAPNPSALSFAPLCFAQSHGQEQATSALSPQGSLALSKAESNLSDSSKGLAAVNSQYAQPSTSCSARAPKQQISNLRC